MKRRTETSCEVKDRWNAQHYEQVIIRVPIGARDEIADRAKAHGMSVAAYLRWLVIRDSAENPETTRNLRGGGDLNEADWLRYLIGSDPKPERGRANVSKSAHLSKRARELLGED